jgi:hypothetical protein
VQLLVPVACAWDRRDVLDADAGCVISHHPHTKRSPSITLVSGLSRLHRAPNAGLISSMPEDLGFDGMEWVDAFDGHHEFLARVGGKHFAKTDPRPKQGNVRGREGSAIFRINESNLVNIYGRLASNRSERCSFKITEQ